MHHACPSIPVKDRVCTVCVDKVDDEVHFLTECKKHETSRNCMLKNIANIHPHIHHLNGKELFIELMTTTNIEILVSIGKFIHQSFNNSSDPGNTVQE